VNNSFVKAAGVCSIVFVVIFVVSTILLLTSGVVADPEKIEAFLQNVNNNTQYAIGLGGFLLGSLFLIPTFLGFYQALSEAGRILWVALAVSLTGVTILLIPIPMELGVVRQFASGYAEAGFSEKPTLEVMARTLLETRIWLYILGLFLSLGIGVVLFSIGVLRTKVIAHWLGWIGVVVGVLYAILLLLFPFLAPSNVIYMAILGVVRTLTFAWLVIMGVFLLRLRESA